MGPVVYWLMFYGLCRAGRDDVCPCLFVIFPLLFGCRVENGYLSLCFGIGNETYLQSSETLLYLGVTIAGN
ncbi:hypothetical protein K1719_042097 [Acacia pycnantha]|nr:hypothetical protein K1719_042097 [Acacia pycnantha]